LVDRFQAALDGAHDLFVHVVDNDVLDAVAANVDSSAFVF
jgi:hypothetical protein